MEIKGLSTRLRDNFYKWNLEHRKFFLCLDRSYNYILDQIIGNIIALHNIAYPSQQIQGGRILQKKILLTNRKLIQPHRSHACFISLRLQFSSSQLQTLSRLMDKVTLWL